MATRKTKASYARKKSWDPELCNWQLADGSLCAVPRRRPGAMCIEHMDLVDKLLTVPKLELSPVALAKLESSRRGGRKTAEKRRKDLKRTRAF